MESVRIEVSNLTDLVSPTPLGLHTNSSMARDSRESRALLLATLATQPQVEGGGLAGETSGQSLGEEVARLLDKVPPTIDDTDLETNYPLLYEESLNTVLRLEVTRYNHLIRVVKQSLADLKVQIKTPLHNNTETTLFNITGSTEG